MGVPFLQNAFHTGVIDPRLIDRVDTKPYYSSLKSGRNVVGNAYGGLDLRGGLRHWTVRRKRLAAHPVETANITLLLAPASGTAADLADGNAATAVIWPAQAAGVALVRVDLGAAYDLSAVDMIGYRIEPGGTGAPNLMLIETSLDGVAWSEWARKDAGLTARTRRIAMPPRQTRAMRYIRISTTTAHGALSLIGLSAWVESGARTNVVVLRHQTAESGKMTLVVSDRNCDVYREFVWTGAIAIPHQHSQIPDITSAHSYETAVLFHRDIRPFRLVRQGSDDEWQAEGIVFQNTPKEKFDGVTEEDMMSDARGWPSCGCFIQARFAMAGFRSLPQSILVSLLADPFNLNTAGTLATDAIRWDLDQDETGLPDIRRMRAGPRLELYTQNGLYFATDAVISKGSTQGFQLAERVGIEPGSRPIDAGQNGFFIQEGGAVIRSVNFDDTMAQKYSTIPETTLSAASISGARDLVIRRAIDETNADFVHVLRANGTWSVMVWLKAQEISGVSPMSTAGWIDSIGMADDASVVFDVRRGTIECLEVYDDTRSLDMSVTRTAAPVMTGLEHLNGRADVCIVQGANRWTSLAVTDGTLAMPDGGDTAGADVEIGIAFSWDAEQQRLAGDAQRQIALNRIVAVNVVQFTLSASGPFFTAVDDEPWRFVEPRGFPVPVDPTLAERLFTGVLEQDGFFGGFDGRVRLHGTSIWPFHLLSIVRDATW